MKSIWSRYLFKEIAKTFCLFALCIYGLYILIDYSSRLNYYQSFSHTQIIMYYLCALSQKTELLVPFAFMIAVIKVLFSMSLHNELVSILMSGRSYKQALRPLLLFALGLSAFLYLNFEIFAPFAQKKVEEIKLSKKSSQHGALTHHLLDDGSQLIFKDYDFQTKQLKSVFLIVPTGDLFFMESLNPMLSPPYGEEVYQFKKDASKKMQLIQRAAHQSFDTLTLDFDPLMKTVYSMKAQPIHSLVKALIWPQQKTHSKSTAEIITELNYQLIYPMLPLVILIALTPLCTRFSRNIPIFKLIAFSVFVLLSFYTVMDAFYILSENAILWPQVALWLPFLAYSVVPLKRNILK